MDDGAGALLVASSDKGVAELCEARTGGLLRTLQDCHPCTSGLTATNRCVVSAEKNRSFLHLWSWGREQPQYRCQAPERLSCVSATSDGAHCIAGAGSGKLYLWQIASGKLLFAWDGHFRPVCTLGTVCADGFLLSAGEDAIINVWSFSQLLRAAESASPAPRPFRTWTAHTLSVTSLSVSDSGHASLIVSCSLDQTIRVWRMGEGVKEAVHGADLGVALTCVATDPTHAAVYAGAVDGRVLCASLIAEPRDRVSSSSGPHVGEPASGARSGLARHAAAVSALCVSGDGARLFTCAADGGYWVWQAGTLALLSRHRTSLKLDSLFFISRPAALAFCVVDRGGSAPFAPFKKFVLPAIDYAGVATPADHTSLGCVPTLLRPNPSEGGTRSNGELPLLQAYEWAPEMREVELDLAAQDMDGDVNVSEMRSQLLQWQDLNIRLQVVAWERQLGMTTRSGL